MTTENRTVIDVSDITAIEFSCKKCGVRHAVPIDSFYEGIRNCPNCQEPIIKNQFLTSHELGDASLVAGIAANLKELARRNLGIKFQILVSGHASDAKA